MEEEFSLRILCKTDAFSPRRNAASTPPLQHRQGERGQDPSWGEQPESTAPVLFPWLVQQPQGAPGKESSSPVPCSLSSAMAKQAGCSAAATTIVIILINPLHAEYCGLLAGPSHTISISRQAGGSQIAHAG